MTATTISRVRRALPHGNALPEARWRARHRGMELVLALLGPGLLVFALAEHAAVQVALLQAALPVAFAGFAVLSSGGPRRVSTVIVALGFMVTAAEAVSAAHGVTEAHFLFFVLIPLLILYEDWAPFLVAFGFVVAHHLVFGLLAADLLYDHMNMGHPVKWALIHGGFVAAASVANIVSWRLNEDVRQLEAAAHARVLEAEETLRMTFDAAPIGMALVALDGRVTSANRALGAFVVTPADELLGRPFGALVDPVDRRSLEAVLAALTGGEGEDWHGELTFSGADGGPAFGQVALQVQRDGNARPLHLIVQVADVTARRHAEAERDRLELDLRLAQKLESVGQLAAGLAHEINTPIQFVGDTIRFLDDAFEDLTRLVAAYDPLLAVVASEPEHARLVEGVDAARDRADLPYLRERVPQACARGTEGIKRVSNIVSAMRQFSLPPTSTAAPVDLNEALRATLTIAANEFRSVADIETDFADVPPVVGNAGDLNQVWLNLIVNASQAVAGTVAADGGRGVIRVRTALDDDHVAVSVADTGGGIALAVRDRIFDPFFTTKPVGKGTGQGLTIARSIVDKHAGALTVEVDEGVGSTFTVSLPIAPGLTLQDREGLAS